MTSNQERTITYKNLQNDQYSTEEIIEISGYLESRLQKSINNIENTMLNLSQHYQEQSDIGSEKICDIEKINIQNKDQINNLLKKLKIYRTILAIINCVMITCLITLCLRHLQNIKETFSIKNLTLECLLTTCILAAPCFGLGIIVAALSAHGQLATEVNSANINLLQENEQISQAF